MGGCGRVSFRVDPIDAATQPTDIAVSVASNDSSAMDGSSVDVRTGIDAPPDRLPVEASALEASLTDRAVLDVPFDVSPRLDAELESSVDAPVAIADVFVATDTALDVLDDVPDDVPVLVEATVEAAVEAGIVDRCPGCAFPTQSCVRGACVPATVTTTVSVGNAFTCTLKNSQVYCSGTNANGSTGQNNTAGVLLVPAPVNDAVPGVWRRIYGLAGASTCGEFAPSSGAPGMYCWGRSYDSFGFPGLDRIPFPFPVLIPAGAVMWRGSTHMFWRNRSGELWTVGSNEFGELGLGHSNPQTSNIEVPSGGDWALLATSWGGTAGIKRDGSLWVWGANSGGRLGNGTTDGLPHPTPTQVGIATFGYATDWIHIAGGDFHYCAMNTRAEVVCWGSNERGEASLNAPFDTEVLVPHFIDPPSGQTWVDVGAAVFESCAIARDNTSGGRTLWCWGDRRPGLWQVGTDTDWERAIGGGLQFCGFRSVSPEPFCFGSNGNGELGTGNMAGGFTPVQAMLP